MPIRPSFLTVLLALGACAAPASVPDVSPPPETAPVVVYVVRHAETEADGTNNPPLSDPGRARAARLADRLSEVAPVVVYATEYRRTQETAEAVAGAAGVEVEVVEFGAGPDEAYASGLAERLRALPPGSAAVVVGHSNTVPALVVALTGGVAPEVGHDAYDGLYVVTLPHGGPGTVEVVRY